MFTGLIEEVGIVKEKTAKSSGMQLTISASIILDKLIIGESVNINGACQTVVKINSGSFSVDTVEETLKKTSLGKLKPSEKVNLERALTPTSRLGGHFVLGHVDTTGKILEIINLGDSYSVNIAFSREFGKLLIPVGSIAVEGISLTLAEVYADRFKVAVIPHTWANTNLSDKKNGDDVNLEFDVLGKYVAKLLGTEKSGGITEDFLKQAGFL